MNKITLTVLLTILFSFSIFAQKDKNQDLEDFSGTWILDEKSSFSTKEREVFKDFTLEITQNETVIKIVQTLLFTGNPLIYTINLFTDKRGEENIYPVKKFYLSGDIDKYQLEEATLRSKTHLKTNKIIREGSYKLAYSNYPFDVKEIYSLSKDGKTMTLITEKTLFTIKDSLGTIVDRNLPTSIGYNFTFHKK